ncbi:hypothetical protein PV04_02931 [Phialophora macrospora]|uniref:Uncharacterized protein n=1 Tax=Phialophora macrospora TaxID=1851006 RepID=A0A0D2CZL5_9EURO|nr:hypothetical protein PV04_02931 [Phialophora macrospora]
MVKHHCKSWGWAYAMAILVVVTIVIVFPILYVAFPNKAQDAINRAELIVTSQSILSPSMNSFYLEQATVFATNSSDSASLDQWEGILCLAPECLYPFARIPVPSAQAENGTQIQISNVTEIINMAPFNNYTRLALESDRYSIYLQGSGKLHKGAWPATTVAYNKNITMRGLNALKGFNVTAFHIINPALADGTNANGTIHIPNPSVSQFELGDLTLNMSVNGMSIGTATLPNVFIAAGNNSIPMTAVTNQTAVAGLVLGPYKSGVLPIDMVATSVTYDGQRIPWYEQALGAVPLRVDLDVIPALQESGLAGMLGLGTPPSGVST